MEPDRPQSMSSTLEPSVHITDAAVTSYLSRPRRKVGWVVPFRIHLRPTGRLQNLLETVSGGISPHTTVRHLGDDIWEIRLPKALDDETQAVSFLNAYKERVTTQLINVATSIPEEDWSTFEYSRLGNTSVDVILDIFLGVPNKHAAIALANSAIDFPAEVLHSILATSVMKEELPSPESMSDPRDLVEKYAEIDAQREIDASQTLGLVALKATELERVRTELDTAVQAARSAGVTWTAIGEAAGVSQQTAHQRWSKSAKRRQ